MDVDHTNCQAKNERHLAIQAKLMAMAKQYADEAADEARVLQQKYDATAAHLADIERQLGGK